MLIPLLLIFILIPIAEMAILLTMGSYFGIIPSLILIVGTGAVGAILARLEGISIIHKIQLDLINGRVPADEVVNGLFVLVSGVLLIIPGAVTDIVGLFLLFPLTRNIAKRLLFKQFLQKMPNSESDPDVRVTSYREI